jgi:hypothetical protein
MVDTGSALRGRGNMPQATRSLKLAVAPEENKGSLWNLLGGLSNSLALPPREMPQK